MADEWIWSEVHQDFYHRNVRYDQHGNVIYTWAKHRRSQPTPQTPQYCPPVHNQASPTTLPHSAHNHPIVHNQTAPLAIYASQHYQTYSNHANPALSQAQHYQTYSNHANPAASQAQQYHQDADHNHANPHQATAQYSQPVSSQPTVAYREGRHSRVDSVAPVSNAFPTQSYDEMPPPAPQHVRVRKPDLIRGTPEYGWCDVLDHTYQMRKGAEAHKFFKKGRVFAMLYSETASGTAKPVYGSDAFTQVKFNEYTYSQIRRFVIVSVKRHFVYACGITTYSGQGTAKPGCNPDEHSIVYFSRTQPEYVAGEYQLRKEPIEIEPSDPSLFMKPASRLRFGKTYPIEWNVKVKDIGRVIPEHLSKLLVYWKEEHRDSDDDD